MISNSTRHCPDVASVFRCAAATALFLSAFLDASSALANGGAAGSDRYTIFSSGGGAAPPGGSASVKTCDKGMVWDDKNKKCVVKHSGALPDRDLTEYAYALAKADRFQEAIDVLDTLQDPNTPRALNYRGYATRKLGRTEEGIRYYLQSVALDPTYAQVREYLGEAYVTLGKFDLAKEQLAMIQKLCGASECEEYDDLAAAIDKGKVE
jgi:tetratricopeptide (TPR) repeat protein